MLCSFTISYISFCSKKVKIFIYFSDQFPDLEKQGLHKTIEQPELLKKVAMDVSADLLVEIMEASNNLAVLKAGEKKSSSSLPTSASGEVKNEKD